MANISGLATATTAATALSNLVLAIPSFAGNKSVIGYQPLNGSSLLNQQPVQTPPALLFHYEGEQTVAIESDITDHYIEDNTAIQDQIALRPEIITTHGFIGELNDVSPSALSTLQTAAQKLTVISAYVPVLSTTALLAYNEALFAYNIGNNAKNAGIAAWSSLSGGNSGSTIINESTSLNISQLQSKQQIYFQQFYAYWKNRVLFSVQTPWAVFSNCAIKTLRAIQDAETNMITDFEVSFKVLNFSTTLTINNNAQGHAAAQVSSVQNNGTSTPAPGPSVSSSLTSVVGH